MIDYLMLCTSEANSKFTVMVGTVLEKAGHGHGSSSSSSGNFNYVSRSKSSEPQQRVERWWQMVLAEQQRQLPKQSSSKLLEMVRYHQLATTSCCLSRQTIVRKKGNISARLLSREERKGKLLSTLFPRSSTLVVVHACCSIFPYPWTTYSLIMKEGKLEGFPWDLKVIVFENFVVILCL